MRRSREKDFKVSNFGGVPARWAQLRRVLCGVWAVASAVGCGAWSTDASQNDAICTTDGNQGWPILASGGHHGHFVAYHSSQDAGSSTSLWLQRLGKTGTPQWGTTGVSVVGADVQPVQRMIADGQDGAILVWTDQRLGIYPHHFFAQRIDAEGRHLWQAGGVRLTGDAGGINSYLIADGTGGALLIWDEYHNSVVRVRGQKVNSNGEIQWAAGGVVIATLPPLKDWLRVVSDGAGGAYAAWTENTRSVQAQRITSTGALPWGSHGKSVASLADGDLIMDMQIAPEASGGVYVGWDAVMASTVSDIYGQHLSSSGEKTWEEAGRAVCSAAGVQDLIQVVSDASGEAVFVWKDHREPDVEDSICLEVYAQRLNRSGRAFWETDGLRVLPHTPSMGWLKAVSDLKGGVLLTWDAAPEGVTSYELDKLNVMAQRVTRSGRVLWGERGMTVCAGPRHELLTDLLADGTGGAIFCWVDYRNSDTNGDTGSTWTDIYGSSVSPGGNLRAGAPAGSQFASTQSGIRNAGSGSPGGREILWFNYKTGEFGSSGYAPTTENVDFPSVEADWIGVFTYDYAAARYTNALYRLTEAL